MRERELGDPIGSPLPLGVIAPLCAACCGTTSAAPKPAFPTRRNRKHLLSVHRCRYKLRWRIESDFNGLRDFWRIATRFNRRSPFASYDAALKPSFPAWTSSQTER